MIRDDFDYNEYGTVYSTYEINRKILIDIFEQMWGWYRKLGLRFPRKVYDIFKDDETGEILCSE